MSGRVFVTGGSGYFGKCLRAVLPLDTTWLSRCPKEGFVTDYPEGKFDYLIDMIPTKVDETIAWASRSGVKRVLYTSSGAVYGRNAVFPHESSTLYPQTPYAVAKAHGELAWQQSGISLVSARPFAFCGKHLPLDHYAIGNFVRDALDGKSIVVSGKSYRSYLDSADLALWLAHLLYLAPEGTYNVGSDQVIDTHSLAAMVRDIVNPGVSIHIKGYEGTMYVPNISKAESLGLERTVTLEQSILRLAENR